MYPPVNTPFSMRSYFLYALGEKRDIDSAIHARRTLFEAAEKKWRIKNQLVNLLVEKGIGLKPIDLAPVHTLWNSYSRKTRFAPPPLV